MGSWDSPAINQPLPDRIAYSFIIAILFHGVWAFFAPRVSAYHVDLRSVLMLLIGSYGADGEFFDSVLRSVVDFPGQIFLYFVSLYASSAAVGFLAHFIVRNRKLDRKHRLLRYDNPWYYLLKGEILDFKEKGELWPETPDSISINVYLTAVVHHSQGDYLYRGIVDEFYFDKDGNLDRVLLLQAHRRKLDTDRAEGDTSDPLTRYYQIIGHYFSLKYSEIHTLNIQYFGVREIKNQQTTLPPIVTLTASNSPRDSNSPDHNKQVTATNVVPPSTPTTS